MLVHMNEMRVDVDRIVADFEAAAERVKRAEQAIAALESELQDARRNMTLRRDFMTALSNYAVPDENVNGEDGQELPTAGPFAGMSGMEASKLFVEMNPGMTMKFSTIFDEMVKRGFDGTENAVNVAFVSLTRDGIVERVSRGLYKLPDAESIRVIGDEDNLVTFEPWATEDGGDGGDDRHDHGDHEETG